MQRFEQRFAHLVKIEKRCILLEIRRGDRGDHGGADGRVRLAPGAATAATTASTAVAAAISTTATSGIARGQCLSIGPAFAAGGSCSILAHDRGDLCGGIGVKRRQPIANFLHLVRGLAASELERIAVLASVFCRIHEAVEQSVAAGFVVHPQAVEFLADGVVGICFGIRSFESSSRRSIAASFAVDACVEAVENRATILRFQQRRH